MAVIVAAAVALGTGTDVFVDVVVDVGVSLGSAVAVITHGVGVISTTCGDGINAASVGCAAGVGPGEPQPTADVRPRRTDRRNARTDRRFIIGLPWGIHLKGEVVISKLLCEAPGGNASLEESEAIVAPASDKVKADPDGLRHDQGEELTA